MTEQEKHRRQRELNKTRYALEDFDEAIADQQKGAIVFFILSLLMLLSLFFGANNAYHLLSTVALISLFAVAPHLNLLRQDRLIAYTAVFFGALLLEFFVLGIPDLLLPALTAQDYTGFPVLMNHLTPYIYLITKIVLGGYVLKLWYNRMKLAACPVADLRKIAPKRFQDLGNV